MLPLCATISKAQRGIFMIDFITSNYTIFIAYLIAVNIVTFAVYGVDKHRAITKSWRIPEATLITLAAVGGSIGALLGMRIFRHKTKHPKFYIGVPVIFIIQIVAVWFFFFK
jgi:uncharacterized membrane protein YsdA (DUF1294 family)